MSVDDDASPPGEAWAVSLCKSRRVVDELLASKLPAAVTRCGGIGLHRWQRNLQLPACRNNGGVPLTKAGK